MLPKRANRQGLSSGLAPRSHELAAQLAPIGHAEHQRQKTEHKKAGRDHGNKRTIEHGMAVHHDPQLICGHELIALSRSESS